MMPPAVHDDNENDPGPDRHLRVLAGIGGAVAGFESLATVVVALVVGVAPMPFGGAGNAIGPIFLEQWVTFARFVLTGGWLRSYRGRVTQ